MIGDPADMLVRLKAVLPTRWFPDTASTLDGLLSGLASTAAWSYGLLATVRMQTRIASASGIFLDLIAMDFFGDRLSRRTGQNDIVFRARIDIELLRERATRPALASLLEDMTGRAPVIFEPGRPMDTGAWGTGLGYGMAGGWGNLDLPFQCFVTALRPTGLGIAAVSGWGGNSAGYGVGPIEYASLSMIEGQITDADIAAAIASVMPIGTIAWMRVTN